MMVMKVMITMDIIHISSIIKIENTETLQFQLLEGYKATTNKDCYVEVLVKNFNIKFSVRVDNFIKYAMPYMSMDAERNILNDDMVLIFDVRDINSVTNNICLISKQSPLYTEIREFSNKYYQHTNENVNTFVPGYTYKFKKSEGTYMYIGEQDVCGYTFGNKANVQQLPTNEDEVSIILPLSGFNKNWINGGIFKRIAVKAHVFMKSNEDGTYSVKLIIHQIMQRCSMQKILMQRIHKIKYLNIIQYLEILYIL